MTTKISRKSFMQACGSLLAGGTILSISAILLRKRVLSDQTKTLQANLGQPNDNTFKSAYKLVSSFSVPGRVECFDYFDDQLIVAVSDNIYIYSPSGTLINNFAIGSNLRDIAVDNGLIYLLFPTRIEVYNPEGTRVREWEACSDQSDYCALTVAPGSVFVTDAANKNICMYTNEGNFVKFIQSPNSFIIPSCTFDIAYVNGLIYCSNSGRHQVEIYSFDGTYKGAFGKAGGGEGMFCGCCNPVHLAYTSTGELITSEKGNPRISCYGSDGQFRSLLLDSGMLGGGNIAYDVKVNHDKLFVAGNNIISTFQYDKVLAATTACSGCAVDCPLRNGINI